MPKKIDLAGKTFGLWKVLGESDKPPSPHIYWDCMCACGTRKPVSGPNLRSGASTNCGCDRQHAVSHGHSRKGMRTKTYRIWKNMHSRCKANYKQAKDYYDRGIIVCFRWYEFSAFLSDMGECPKGMSLDRIDNDGIYEPENCRWVSASDQRRNSRRVNHVEFLGAVHVLKDACASAGFSDTAVYQDRKRNGGSLQQAFDRVLSRKK